MRRARTIPLLASVLLLACAGSPDRRTLAGLRDVEPDMTEVRVEDSLDQAIRGYRAYLEEAPESALTPEAMRRLADLKLEKEYGLLGDGELVERAAPEPEQGADVGGETDGRPRVRGLADHSESSEAFERRAGSETGIAPPSRDADLELPEGSASPPSGPLEAIALYDRILATYPGYEHKDQVLYQKARAFDELGRVDEAVAVMEELARDYPTSRHMDEVQFRRAEYFFTRKRYMDAEEAYQAVTAMGPGSEYYELALYKLGWTFYKQELHEEALDEYVALLDYKVATGYDFDQSDDEADERRIADTYRVISLAFSSLGGPEVVESYFAEHGERSYEDRIYSHLGEFYFEKLRYHDAARTYEAFVDLHPLHRAAPHFSMRRVEIYEAGGFPILVLEAKKEFAADYGLESPYWEHFDVADAPEVLAYLKANLTDLASHYHALYQEEELVEERPENFREASRWYRAYLKSFPDDEKAPSINYRLADLLLENRDFADAAREYERTAYEHPEHEQAAAAGYAAIYAHRESQKAAEEGVPHDEARRRAVESTVRFVDAFPGHEEAATVLGAAVDDLYDMGEFERTIAVGHRLIDDYPESEPAIRRAAWAAIANANFDTAAYAEAEAAYARVLEMTPEDDESRQDVIDNLAASIYKQGEQAARAEDHRAAADHYLRVARVAPSSEIRPLAEYDAAAELIRLEDWAAAADVLESFRESHPEHELHEEATKQIAFVYREQGDLSRAAGEYERVAAEADDPELRREALLVAGELYEDSGEPGRALSVYRGYVEAFPKPLELAIETRFKIAELHESMGDDEARRAELRRIVDIDAAAGAERTPRVRYLAARSALVLTEGAYDRFAEVELVQPFERNLQEKQRRMKAAIDAFGRLVDYEVGEVTAAATYYMAEIYHDFSQSLLGSERPAGLSAAELQDYEMVLEEEAFPFEERAIGVHEKNLELMSSGVYNRWIERSLARLGVLMPGRYAKFEASAGWIASIDSYAYRAPNAAPPGGAEPEVVETAEVATPEPTEAPPAATSGSAPAEPAAEAEEPAAESAAVSPAPTPEPVPAEPVVEQPAAEQPASIGEEPAADEPVAAATSEVATPEPAAAPPAATSDPSPAEPAAEAEEPATAAESAAVSPAPTPEPAPAEPVVEQPAAEQPASIGEEPAADEPVAAETSPAAEPAEAAPGAEEPAPAAPAEPGSDAATGPAAAAAAGEAP